ncbi:ExeM/NucH family extracellular endonuclease [Parendozoicomonas sp. Alg238-R29]|uniref:ExeM/NucH family extracellular endonuclease n=1 Tax=Parendozoicomonas sp. Alg238-R29 TaxID=2993446 RepID=UPI00248F40F5|nr:ExeM/NucH family extracellular endonuclease [Parendozoicomonas sp. Alg238-R29]
MLAHRRFLASSLLVFAPFLSSQLTAQTAPSMSCGSCATLISEIQGNGGTSPLIPAGATESQEVVIEAVVTANTPERLNGFFLQEEVADEDGDPDTSEGLFIYGERSELKVGDKVRARGVIREFYGQTQMVLSEVAVCGVNALGEVKAATPSKGLVLQEMEKYEGMMVNFSGRNTLSVTRNYSFDYSSYRNNMEVSLGGPLFKPTQVHPPLSDAAIALAEANDKNRMTVITDGSQTNGQISYYPAFGPYIHYIRVGDFISDMTGVVAYRYGRYELLPTMTLDTYAFQHNFSPRVAFPSPHTHGTLRVASFNVLNYFNTLMPDHKDNPLGTNRGATTEREFQLQRDKIVEAITRIDADIIGLMEIENNGFGTGSAINDLLTTVNSRLPASEHYAAVRTYESGTVGTDAITVGLVYKPNRIVLQDSLQIIAMPVQQFTLTSTDDEEVSITKSMRPTLLQTFRDKFSGDAVTVAVSHFKSKGSMCYEDYMEYADPDGKIPLDGTRIKRGSKPTVPGYQDDLQGSCNEFRVAASKHLGDHLQRMNYLLTDNVLLIGDFNAYGQEDPVRLLTGGKSMKQPVTTSSNTTVNCRETTPQTLDKGFGMVNLATKEHGRKIYSYSYDGELGALDHALANKTLATKVINVQDWHINSVENTLFEYPDKYSGDLPKDLGPFSASDHDPILIDIDFYF